jgi:hypothetical protein
MPCLTPGILIETETGHLPVEKLRVGDRVMTRDHGLQVLQRICVRHLTARQLFDNPHVRPIAIAANAFDHGMPCQDTMLSPNTRLPVASEKTGFLGRLIEENVAIKNMVDHDAIRPIDVVGTDYYLLVFDRHEVIAANGFWMECFHPTDTSLKNEGNAQRVEIQEVFPELQKRVQRSETHRVVRRVLLRDAY